MARVSFGRPGLLRVQTKCLTVLRDIAYNQDMTNSPFTPTPGIGIAAGVREFLRSLSDEDLDETRALLVGIAGYGTVALDRVDAEIARRAEIKINRHMDVEYGPNPYGFTADDISAKHDASWYESRQTEDEFLAEMGVAL